MKQKRVSESGTQQLLLDTYNLKTMLLQLHHLGLPDSPPQEQERSVVPPMFMKLVTSKATHIEVILKLVGTPEDMLLERFKIMWPEGGAADLQAVMTLQGIRKLEQQQYLEQFGRETGKYEEMNGGEDESGLDLKSHPPTAGVSGSSSATAAASAAVASSMRSVSSVTQDLSSSTRSALGDLTKSFKFGRNSQ